MFIESETKYNFDDTINNLVSNIEEYGWKVTHIHDLQATLKKNGKEVSAVKVIETCNPNLAYKILSVDSERIYSNMLPCRLSIFEKADGKTYISRMDIPQFASQIDSIASDVMNEAFQSMEKIVAKILK